MEEYLGLLISSARTLERNASSELYYMFTELLQYEDVSISPVKEISGLSLAKLKKDPIIALKETKQIIENDASVLRYVLKIVPIQYRISTNLRDFELASEIFSSQIKTEDTWKINLRRRHTTISREEIIGSIASKISQGKVMLDNPHYYIIVEILGKWTYLALSSIPELSVSKYLPEEAEDDFSF